MKKTLIMTDANAGFSKEEAQNLHLQIVPMPFMINGEEYYEGINLSVEEFSAYLNQGAKISTSQPSSYVFEEMFETGLKEYEEIVFIPMSSGLSSSCANAKKIAEQFNGKVIVVDNHRVCIPLKESVLEACAMVNEGKSGKEIQEYLEKTGSVSSVYVYMDTLKYLKKGGRVKPAVALFATLLMIKPILSTRGYSFDMHGRCRSFKEGKKKMINQLRIDCETEFKEYYEKGLMTISINHSGLEREAEEYKKELIAAFPKAKFHFIQFFPFSAACHIGPNALGVAITINSYPLPEGIGE